MGALRLRLTISRRKQHSDKCAGQKKRIIEDTPNFRWRLEYARQKNCITEARSLRSAATLLLEFRLRFEFECLRVGFLRPAHENTRAT